MAAIEVPPTVAELDSLLCSSSFASSTSSHMSLSHSASMSSTPPTTVSPDSMSLASEPDAHKPDSIVASSIEAIIALPDPTQETRPEPEQRQSGQQTPVGHDAIVVAEEPLPSEPPSASRPRRARSSLPVYNLARLAGTDVHGRRRSRGDIVQEKRRRTISDATPADQDGGVAQDSIDALPEVSLDAQAAVDASPSRRQPARVSTPRNARISKKFSSSPAATHLTRRATRHSGASAENLATKLSSLSKRGKKAVEKALGGMSRELRRLQDTNEFAHIDTRPVKYTVWSNGKYVEVDPNAPTPAPEPPRKKAKISEKAAAEEQKPEVEKQEPAAPPVRRPRAKKWLEKGLYAGQEAPMDIFKGLTAQEKKKLASLPELMPSGKTNRSLPQPMYNGLRILINGRDFKLPFDVCNPLPPGQPKPAAYRTMTKNRFVGNAAAYWKKTPHFGDSSKCVCKPEDGCDEDCQNRIMLYECDETNCNVGKAHCTNRAFQDLTERTKKGGRYRVGVEVYKTGDRGYGVRSNRCFEANQIIMEYTGEIITEEECERRMNEEYKDNECYYLMSFDQNMIIDATTGSIARFVNHSCSPNCRMIKWIVSGQPRMALFAGDRPIMTGEELTYDYNFDPFSAKNVQKCLCGSANCRGVLGPKPKEVKLPKPPKEEKKRGKTGAKAKASAKSPVKAAATKPATKRKLKDAFEFDGHGEDDGNKPVKKRKIAAVAGLKKSLSAASLKKAKGAAKGAVTTIKRSVSSISVTAKKNTGVASKLTKTKKTITATKTKTATVRRAAKGGVVAAAKKAYGKKAAAAATAPASAGAATKTKPKTQSKTEAKTLIQTKIVIPSRSPSLTIVAAGVTASSSTSSTAAPASATPSAPASTSTPKPTAKTSTTATPGSASSISSKHLLRLTLSGSGSKASGRKFTPSRKAIEAGLVAAVESGLGETSPVLSVAKAVASVKSAKSTPPKTAKSVKAVGSAKSVKAVKAVKQVGRPAKSSSSLQTKGAGLVKAVKAIKKAAASAASSAAGKKSGGGGVPKARKVTKIKAKGLGLGVGQQRLVFGAGAGASLGVGVGVGAGAGGLGTGLGTVAEAVPVTMPTKIKLVGVAAPAAVVAAAAPSAAVTTQ